MQHKPIMLSTIAVTIFIVYSATMLILKEVISHVFYLSFAVHGKIVHCAFIVIRNLN